MAGYGWRSDHWIRGGTGTTRFPSYDFAFEVKRTDSDDEDYATTTIDVHVDPDIAPDADHVQPATGHDPLKAFTMTGPSGPVFFFWGSIMELHLTPYVHPAGARVLG